MFLALATALGYILMGAGVIHAADLTLDSAPPGFTWIAGAFFIIGGILLLQKRRWTAITMAIVSFIAVVFFYFKWSDRPDVMWSAPGLIIKIAQVLMLAGLLYLIFKPAPKAVK
jgi:hypothetical protein